MSFTDIHHHLLWGLDDDGPQTREDMATMIHQAVSDHTTTLIATPHVAPGLRYFDEKVFIQRLGEARNYCVEQSLPLTILAGAELMYTEMTGDMLRKGKVPTIAGSDYVLVEFPTGVTARQVEGAVARLASDGFISIIAHAERYPALTVGHSLGMKMKNRYRTRFQVNADTFLHHQRFLLKRFLYGAVREGLIDFISSDAHGTRTRRTTMKQCHTMVEEKFGVAAAQLLFSGNAERMLAEIGEIK